MPTIPFPALPKAIWETCTHHEVVGQGDLGLHLPCSLACAAITHLSAVNAYSGIVRSHARHGEIMPTTYVEIAIPPARPHIVQAYWCLMILKDRVNEKAEDSSGRHPRCGVKLNGNTSPQKVGFNADI